MSSHKAKAMLMAMAIMSLAGLSSAVKFDTIRPIIYQETDKFIDVGVTQYSIDFTFSNPCELLNSFLTAPNQASAAQHEPNSVLNHQMQIEHSGPSMQQLQQTVINQPSPLDISYINTYLNECHKLYLNTWMIKINELLSRQQPIISQDVVHELPGHVITKRSLGDAFFGVVVYNFISSLFEKINPWSTYSQLKQVSELQKAEQERLMKFKHEFNVSIAIQKGMIDLIAANARSIRDQNRQMSQFVHLSSQLTWLSSFIQSRILFATADLRTVIDEFTHRRVATLELSELFNMTELRGVDPLETEFISVQSISQQTLRFIFNVRLAAVDTSVYHVHAFRYWDNLTLTPTMMEYHGNRFIIYNKTSNCIRGLEDTPERGIMMDCAVANFVDPGVNVWRRVVTTKDIYSQDITTYKRTPKMNYIYCFPFNITVDGQTTRCPTLMFKLPVEKAFVTGNISYVPQIRRIKVSRMEHNFIEDVSLGHFDENSLASSDVTMFDRVQQLTELNAQLLLEQQQSITITKHGSTWWSTILLVLALVLITIGLATWNLRLSKTLQSRSKQVANDVAELKTYERISCVNCAKNTSNATSIVQGLQDGRPKVEVGRDESIVINVNPGSRPLPTIHSKSTIL